MLRRADKRRAGQATTSASARQAIPGNKQIRLPRLRYVAAQRHVPPQREDPV
jgi:hypothetical protein